VVGDEQSTAFSVLDVNAAGGSIGALVQRLPSHVSISGRNREPVAKNPTATHQSAEGQDTPSSSASGERGGPEIGTVLHRTPSHVSANGP
jgi:hypothetical protein